MIKNKFNVLSLVVSKDTPDENEWKTQFGADSLLREATSNVWYRSTAAELRPAFLNGREEEKNDKGEVVVTAIKGLDDLTGIARLTKKEKKGDKEVELYDEKEGAFFKRVIATLVKDGKQPSEEAALAWAALRIQEVADLIPFDATRVPPAEKKAKTVPAEFTTSAQGFVSTGKAAKVAKYLTKTLGRPVSDTDVADLAKALHEDDKRIKAVAATENAKKLAAMFA